MNTFRPLPEPYDVVHSLSKQPRFLGKLSQALWWPLCPKVPYTLPQRLKPHPQQDLCIHCLFLPTTVPFLSLCWLDLAHLPALRKNEM